MVEMILYIWKYIIYIFELLKKLFLDFIIIYWEVRKGFDSKKFCFVWFCVLWIFMLIIIENLIYKDL